MKRCCWPCSLIFACWGALTLAADRDVYMHSSTPQQRPPQWTYTATRKTTHSRRRLRELQYKGSDYFRPQKLFGDVSCPCLSADEMAAVRREAARIENQTITATATNDTVIDNDNDDYTLADDFYRHDNPYGVGCAPHDEDGPYCVNLEACTRRIPVDANCENSWCSRSWCYVNRSNCQVRNEPSSLLPNISFSFAACGHMREVSFADLVDTLNGTALRVALNHNTGGWRGAYHDTHQSFSLNPGWNGPVYEFLVEAAQRGGFALNITAPPLWLRHESYKFFGHSSFDYCVYATALGYLDLCVAEYTITVQRASVTPFFETNVGDVYLVVFRDTERITLHYITRRFRLIFEPFTAWSWFVIFVLCLPILGLLMLYHEYDKPGSAFPKQYTVQVQHAQTGRVLREEALPISWLERLGKTLYMALLSFFAQDYATFVISVGGKVHLLALLLFLWLVSTVYTANLAAILTMNIQRSDVNSLAQAMALNYRFCATRQLAEVVAEVHRLEPADQWILPDPLKLGGDGKPGFQCQNCMARTRVLDFMKPPPKTTIGGGKNHHHDHDKHDNEHDRDLYCDAAFVSKEDLDYVHSLGRHCNKTAVGAPLAFASYGIPMFSKKATLLTSLLYALKFDGTQHRIYEAERPQPQCAAGGGEGGEGDDPSLTVEQLSGVWGSTFALVVAGLMAKAGSSLWRRRKERNSNDNNHEVVRKEYYFDQWGNQIDNPNLADRGDVDDYNDEFGNDDDDDKPNEKKEQALERMVTGFTAPLSSSVIMEEQDSSGEDISLKGQRPGIRLEPISNTTDGGTSSDMSI